MSCGLGTLIGCLSARRKAKKQDLKKDDSSDGIPLHQINDEAVFGKHDTYHHVRRLQNNEDGQCNVLESKTTGKLVVVKRVYARNCKSPPSEQTGRRKPLPLEARMLLCKLQPHPNIIRLFDSLRDPLKSGRHILFFEYCACGDLLDQLHVFRKREMDVPVMFTLHVFVGMVHALAYLHHGLRHESGTKFLRETNHAPIIHGDIKPDNIFLRWPGKQECGMPDIVLADFGMAKLESESSGITGTPGYDSPEGRAVSRLYDVDRRAYNRAKNAKVMTTKSDIYQLGLIICLMAASEMFSIGADPYTTDMKLPQQYRELIGFQAAVVWMLQPEPKQRPECTGDLESGILFATDVIRKQRDAIFEKNGPLDRCLWNVSGSESEVVNEDCYGHYRGVL